MIDDKPRAALRTLLHETALVIDQMTVRGYTTEEKAIFTRVYAAARLGLGRSRAASAPPPDREWVDGCWAPIGSETDPAHDTD